MWHSVCFAPFPPSLNSLSEHDWCKPFPQPRTLQGHHMAGLDNTLWYFSSFIPNQLTVNPWHPSKGTRLFIQLNEKTQTHFDTVSANCPDNPKACQEDKPDVMQALSRAVPDLGEGISSRNFPPLWWELGCHNLSRIRKNVKGGQKKKNQKNLIKAPLIIYPGK